MALAEWESMSTLSHLMPDFCPKPVGWGTYASDPNVHFVITELHEMVEGPPDVELFPEQLTELHRRFVSANLKYGWGSTGYYGTVMLNPVWTATWEECFTLRTMELLRMELEAQGTNEEIERLAVPFKEKVIPRLLRPMETQGHKIKPCLVHGDLWQGTVSTDAKMEKPLIHDATCWFAHNECTCVRTSHIGAVEADFFFPQMSSAFGVETAMTWAHSIWNDTYGGWGSRTRKKMRIIGTCCTPRKSARLEDHRGGRPIC